MFWSVLKSLGWILLLFLIYVIFRFVKVCLKHREYAAKGVIFSGSPLYSFLNDFKLMITVIINEGKTALPYRSVLMKMFPGDKMPPMVGQNWINHCRIVITDPKVLSEVYTDMNKYHSKAKGTRDALGLLARSSIIFQPTEEADYHPKRKALSQAFFKKKITSLIEIIKTVTLKHLVDTDDQAEVDLPMFTKDL
jgi:hypothetical protein